MSFLIKVSQLGLIAVPEFGRCNVNISPVAVFSLVAMPIYYRLSSGFIGKDAKLIFEGKRRKI